MHNTHHATHHSEAIAKYEAALEAARKARADIADYFLECTVLESCATVKPLFAELSGSAFAPARRRLPRQ